MAIIQKCLSYVHPWFINLATPEQPREEEREQEGQSEISSDSVAPPNPRNRRRASAPEMIQLSCLRPPSQERSFSSSFASLYQDAVINIIPDSDSDV